MDQRAAAIFYWLVRKMIDTLERTFGKLQGSAKRVGKLSWKKPADWDGGYCRVYLCHQGIPLTKSNVHGVQQCLGQWYMSNSTWWPRPKVSQLNLCAGRDTISAGFPFFSYCILLLFFFPRKWYTHLWLSTWHKNVFWSMVQFFCWHGHCRICRWWTGVSMCMMTRTSLLSIHA